MDREHRNSPKWLICPDSNLQLRGSNMENEIKDSSCFVPGSCDPPLHLGGLQKKNSQQLQGRQTSATVTPAMSSGFNSLPRRLGRLPAHQPPVLSTLLCNWVLAASRQAAACPAAWWKGGHGGGWVVAVAGSVGGTGMHQHWLERQEMHDSSQWGWEWASTIFTPAFLSPPKHNFLNH